MSCSFVCDNTDMMMMCLLQASNSTMSKRKSVQSKRHPANSASFQQTKKRKSEKSEMSEYERLEMEHKKEREMPQGKNGEKKSETQAKEPERDGLVIKNGKCKVSYKEWKHPSENWAIKCALSNEFVKIGEAMRAELQHLAEMKLNLIDEVTKLMKRGRRVEKLIRDAEHVNNQRWRIDEDEGDYYQDQQQRRETEKEKGSK